MLNWIDEELPDPQTPLFESTAKLYCRVCKQHKIDYWSEHLESNSHSHNKRKYKVTYFLVLGTLLFAFGAIALVVIMWH